MARRNVIIKFAGVSVATDENGKSVARFHKSDKRRYSVWSDLPDNADGPGQAIVFHFFKLPPNMLKFDAIRFVQRRPELKSIFGEHKYNLIQNTLNEILKENEPKAPKRLGRKPTVTVEIKKSEGTETKSEAPAEPRRTATAARKGKTKPKAKAKAKSASKTKAVGNDEDPATSAARRKAAHATMAAEPDPPTKN